MNQKMTIELSWRSILKVVAVFLLLLLLYLIRSILVMVLLAIILASIFVPIVDRFERQKIPRTISTLFIYLILFGLVTFIVFLIIPPLAFQLKQLGADLPLYFERWNLLFQKWKTFSLEYKLAPLSDLLKYSSEQLSQLASNVALFTFRILGGIFSTIIILVLAFYMIVEKRALEKFLASFLAEKQKEYALSLISKIQKTMSQWAKGTLSLGLIVGLLDFIAFFLLGIQYALLLALVGGILELVPIVGPILTGIIAVIITFPQSPFLALMVALLIFGIQQFENHVLVPKVMAKAVGLNPVVILLALLIGAKLLGFLGILLAIPVATTILVVIKNLPSKG